MIKFQAVNNVIILVKDKAPKSPIIIPDAQQNSIYEIPEPYTGIIDSIGMENEWNVGDHIAFCDIGGLYMKVEDIEYVIITPDMIIGKL